MLPPIARICCDRTQAGERQQIVDREPGLEGQALEQGAIERARELSAARPNQAPRASGSGTGEIRPRRSGTKVTPWQPGGTASRLGDQPLVRQLGAEQRPEPLDAGAGGRKPANT